MPIVSFCRSSFIRVGLVNYLEAAVSTENYSVIQSGGDGFIKAWNHGVPFEDKAIEQMKNTARMPFVFKYVAAMPDAHWGLGSTVGTVLPTKGAIIPAAVGVDIGCGMLALKTSLTSVEVLAADLPTFAPKSKDGFPQGEPITAELAIGAHGTIFLSTLRRRGKGNLKKTI
jgi:hypothetical protein